MSNDSVKQEQINKAVWNACDTFRGTVDPSIYKDYVLTMLFVKYLSDVYQDHYNSYIAEYGDAPELIEELMKNELLRHILEDFARSEFNLSPSRIGKLDVIGNADEYLIKNFAATSGKKAGEFYTSPEVSELMAELIEPKEVERKEIEAEIAKLNEQMDGYLKELDDGA